MKEITSKIRWFMASLVLRVVLYITGLFAAYHGQYNVVAMIVISALYDGVFRNMSEELKDVKKLAEKNEG